MSEENPSTLKHREILFRGPHAEGDQARKATLVLSCVEGVVDVRPEGPDQLRVTYDVSRINLQIIEALLEELGFHLDNNLLNKLKRALYYYCEDAERAQLECGRGQSNCTQAVFIEQYRQRPHGCRDDRPEYWRRYL